ncbi:MAG: hypothetical protein P8Y43_08185 [Sulfurovaceae bacterium]
MAQIIVKRDFGWVDGGRKYKIFLDNQEVAKLKQKESVVLDVNLGEHEIYAKLDFSQTKKIKFVITKEEDKKDFFVFSQLRGVVGITLAIIYTITIFPIFIRETWIQMKEL